MFKLQSGDGTFSIVEQLTPRSILQIELTATQDQVIIRDVRHNYRYGKFKSQPLIR
jgi:hypothetical protein